MCPLPSSINHILIIIIHIWQDFGLTGCISSSYLINIKNLREATSFILMCNLKSQRIIQCFQFAILPSNKFYKSKGNETNLYYIQDVAYTNARKEAK